MHLQYRLWLWTTREHLKMLQAVIKNTEHVVTDETCLLNPVYTIQPVLKPVVQPVWQSAVSCKQTSNRLSNVVTDETCLLRVKIDCTRDNVMRVNITYLLT